MFFKWVALLLFLLGMYTKRMANLGKSNIHVDICQYYFASNLFFYPNTKRKLVRLKMGSRKGPKTPLLRVAQKGPNRPKTIIFKPT